MVPPYSIETLKRKVTGKDPIKIFLLYKGENTEKFLINPLLSSNIIVATKNIVFRPIIKEGNDKGITNPFALIKYAIEFVKQEIKNKNFLSGRDKVMVVFDLDVMKNDQQKMNELLSLKTNDLILCYTNPAIELFMLLTLPYSFEKIIEPNKNKILENDFDKNGDRFIYGLLKENMPKLKDTKRAADIDFTDVIANIEKAFMQEKFINNKLSQAANNLTSNIAYTINKISKEDFNFEAAFWWMIFFHLLGGFLAGLLSHKKVKCHCNDCGCDFILYG